ncbi:ribosome recycling factor [Aaosphaeria arxii CBS 175.79]|uniref:Ribosome recycling factor n=1 Tax=Aaosphaeria arxii CBS 175.79 TaxID=1450172 RepID=A0A6A5Y594_9PLEO|nr:ribosome recycling factor [Aaosphaeria arxii CBS 175.79]KAF2020658.1 ribosome recycling factor [Aaosphaeria arxii CBS 175.79]
MSRSVIPRVTQRLNPRIPLSIQLRAIGSPQRHARLSAACAHEQTCNTARSFSSTPGLLKKAGKANKVRARSDSSPPVTDASGPTAVDEAYDMSGLESQILKAIERLTHELSQLRSGGRLNPSVVESLKVQLGTAKEGKETVRLGDIAQVVPKGRLLNVMLGEQSHVKPVTSAIAASTHNLTPQQPHADSPLTIPVPIPPPTGESRQAALETAQKASEQADRAIHDARASHNKKLRKFGLDKAVLPDDLQKAGKRMEEVVKKGHSEVKRITEGAKKVLESQ